MVTDLETADESRSVDSSVARSSATPIDSFVVVVIGEEDGDTSSVPNSLELKIEFVDVDLKENKTSCVIDLKSNEGQENLGLQDSGGERVCRICHLNSDQCKEMMTTRAGLIQLGCGCKDELGIAHGHCSESWFKIKGNRRCEICGETAKNVMGGGDYRFMEAWNQDGGTTQGGAGGGNTGGVSDGSGRGCCRRQPFCNFLVGCLVIAFVLPWFFRVNMF